MTVSVKEEQPGDSSSTSSSSSSTVHVLPCSIDYDGVSQVTSYFMVQKDTKDDLLHSKFRGRDLVGKEVVVPETMKVFHSVVPVSKGGNKNSLEIVEEVQRFNIWQHDSPPDMSNIQECMDWMEIANAVSFANICASVDKCLTLCLMFNTAALHGLSK